MNDVPADDSMLLQQCKISLDASGLTRASRILYARSANLPNKQAVVTERLRWQFKALFRKSVGSIPTDCKIFANSATFSFFFP